MRNHRSTRWAVVLLCFAMVVGSCSWGGGDDDTAEPEAGVADDGTGPFALRLSTGDPLGRGGDALAVVAGDALDDGGVAAVTERLPALEEDADDRTDFKRPPESLPPPRVGATVELPFGVPDAATPPEVPSGPLEVLRHQPDGEVAVAPFISITFDQPMVPVGTLEALDAEEVPVEVSPAIEGRWRWLGTKTLRLEHTSEEIDRLPGATEYTVTVPAGTESATGGKLAEAFSFTFATPAPELVSFTPDGEVIDTSPVFFAGFDQRVEPTAVLDTITLTADGDERGLRLATDEEIAADDAARALDESTLDGRGVGFTVEKDLPGDAAIEIAIGPGTPSTEGPRTTAEATTRATRTYAPLKVTKTICGFAGCRPGSFVAVEFNNPIDPDEFDSDTVTIDPATGASFVPQGNQLTTQAATRANTTYEITLPAELTDVFGQTLGSEEKVSFEVKAAAPVLQQFPRSVITTDPFAPKPRVPIVSAGQKDLDVTVYRVTIDEFPAYQAALDDWARSEDFAASEVLDFPVAFSDTIEVEGDPAELTETNLDLSEVVGDAGQAVVFVESNLELSKESEDYWNNRPTVAWVQTTSIGLDAVIDHDQMVAWATDLETGAPVPDVDVRLGGGGATATTDGNGLAELPVKSERFLVATAGDRSAVLTADQNYQWDAFPLADEARWYTFDGRGLFRPGDEFRMKGFVRRLALSGDASISPVGGATVKWTARDSFGNELAKGDAPLTGNGGFDITAALPAGAALGQAFVELSLTGAEGIPDTFFQHSFQIEEFRRPEFEVVTEVESAEPQVLTAPVTISATASYFSGGTLPDAPVVWQVNTRNTLYSPPNRPDFTFGVAPPPWFFGDEFRFDGGFDGRIPGGMIPDGGMFPYDDGLYEEPESFTYNGRTDASGAHVLDIDFTGQKPDEPVIVNANASVEDVNRQAFASNIDVLVHPADLYVGLRGQRNFVRQGEPLVIDAVVTDIDGVAVPGREFTVTASRVNEKFENGELTEVDVDPQECVIASKDDPVTCEFDTATGGKYRISATVNDDGGGTNRTELIRYVTGAEAVPSRSVEEQIVTLVPDSIDYSPGDTAEVLVVSPFTDGTGLLTISAGEIVETRTFELSDGSAVLEIPITDAHVLGLDARVDLSGVAPRVGADGKADGDLPLRPAFASGSLPLTVKPATRTLSVTAEPAATDLEPGESTTVDIAVEGPDGKALSGAEVAVVVVDEAVLSLVDYELGDPIESIYSRRFGRMRAEHSRSGILLDDPTAFDKDASPEAPSTTVPAMGDGDDSTAGNASGGYTAGKEEADGLEPLSGNDGALRQTAESLPAGSDIDIRSDFAELVAFAPTVITSDNGHASIKIDLPDSLTRYRVMAVAADGGSSFGSGESTITARLPLQVRPSAPRFVNFGDTFEFPVVLQNQSDDAMTADVVLEATNLSLTAESGRRVEIPAKERVEVRFPVSAEDAGTVRYRATVVSGDRSDSATGSFPAYTPTTTEAFATYGVVDDGAVAQPLQSPEGVVEQFGGLQIDTSSTALSALTDAVVYLNDYEYQSADAYASRITALVSLRGVFAAFALPGKPSAEDLDATIRSDLEALVALQNDDGGFAAWQRGRPSDPFLTVQAAHALITAEADGFAVDQNARQRVLDYAKTIEEHFPAWWSPEARRPVEAYALFVRNLAGDRDSAKAHALYRDDADLPLDALAWLWPVVDDAGIDSAIEKEFSNRVTETPAGANFTTGYDEQAAALVLASDRRTDGIILDSLITKRPGSDLIPKVVNGLVANQRKGRWNNIQENGFILLAMKHYFDSFEDVEPAFVSRAWLGDDHVAEHAHKGRSIDTTRTMVPMSELGGDPDIVLGKDGPGRLYYRLGLTYAPDDLTLEARDEGFVVTRTYEAIDDDADVARNDDGTWTITPGAMVRVRLSMVADAQRTNMALVDHLPAGLEALNPALAASPAPPAEEIDEDSNSSKPSTWFGFTWYDHQNFRDDRTEAFASWLPGGVYEYTYVARATTPGTFVVPPAKAEEIYSPEVFGRSSTDKVKIG